MLAHNTKIVKVRIYKVTTLLFIISSQYTYPSCTEASPQSVDQPERSLEIIADFESILYSRDYGLKPSVQPPANVTKNRITYTVNKVPEGSSQHNDRYRGPCNKNVYENTAPTHFHSQEDFDLYKKREEQKRTLNAALYRVYQNPKECRLWSSTKYLRAFVALFGHPTKDSPDDILVCNAHNHSETSYLSYKKLLECAKDQRHQSYDALWQCFNDLGIYEKIIGDLHHAINTDQAHKKRKLTRSQEKILQTHIAIVKKQEFEELRLLRKQKAVLHQKFQEQQPLFEGIRQHCHELQQIYAVYDIGTHNEDSTQHAHNIHNVAHAYYEDWKKLCNNPYERINQRLDALQALENGGAIYDKNTYALPANLEKTMRIISGYNLPKVVQRSTSLSQELCTVVENTFAPMERFYTTCYGNQLQQAIHQECLALFHAYETIDASHSFYLFKGALADCTDAALGYNHAGDTVESIKIADFCWSIIDYSKQLGSLALQTGAALTKGVATGVIDSVVPAGLYLAFGNYYVAAQVGMLIAQAASLGIDAYRDPGAAWKTWEQCLNNLGELSRFELLEKGTACVTSFFAPSRLALGIRTLGAGIKLNAINFRAKNPRATPADYMATPEGVFLKGVMGERGSGISKMEGGGSVIQDIKQKIPSNLPKNLQPTPTPKIPFSAGLNEQQLINIAEKSFEWTIRENKLHHLFGNEGHMFDRIITECGTKEKIIALTLKELVKNPQIPKEGIFKNIPIDIAGHSVYTRGFICDGIVKIGTMFIPH